MLKIENTEVLGWEHAIRGMRNPLNSWEKSDSCWRYLYEEGVVDGECIGPNDLDLMKRLAKGGPVEAKYRRMIVVYADITAPLYFFKEFDTYKVGTVTNSCSTMHKIHAKEFTLDDFSHEHLWGAWDIDVPENEADTDCWVEDTFTGEVILPFDILEQTIAMLNKARELYLYTKTKPMKDEAARARLMKKYWWQMIQLLPSSYNQKRTVMMNYEVLHNIYKSRRHHKLDCWHTLCDWIESLPYSELITGKEKEE